MNSLYYDSIAEYYDRDAANFEERYWKNDILQRIRQSFREVVKKHPSKNILEIGFGTGIDICHFAAIYPDSKIFGIDISPEMFRITQNKIRKKNLRNVIIEKGTAEDLEMLFPGLKFDLIYVFFGALNTVKDLDAVSDHLSAKLNPDGKMVLSFVNKWYMAEIFINLLKCRFKKAFRRLKKDWGGYSGEKYLESRCLSPSTIESSFTRNFKIDFRKGYSILYPPWYRVNWIKRLGRRICDRLWIADKYLNKTFVWRYGEYILYELSTSS